MKNPFKRLTQAVGKAIAASVPAPKPVAGMFADPDEWLKRIGPDARVKVSMGGSYLDTHFSSEIPIEPCGVPNWLRDTYGPGEYNLQVHTGSGWGSACPVRVGRPEEIRARKAALKGDISGQPQMTIDWVNLLPTLITGFGTLLNALSHRDPAAEKLMEAAISNMTAPKDTTKQMREVVGLFKDAQEMFAPPMVAPSSDGGFGAILAPLIPELLKLAVLARQPSPSPALAGYDTASVPQPSPASPPPARAESAVVQEDDDKGIAPMLRWVARNFRRAAERGDAAMLADEMFRTYNVAVGMRVEHDLVTQFIPDPGGTFDKVCDLLKLEEVLSPSVKADARDRVIEQMRVELAQNPAVREEAEGMPV